MTLMTGILLFTHTGCKKSNDTVKPTLNVTVSIGAKGTPTAGEYVYDIATEVAYEYILKDRYKDLKVTLDGQTIASSGTISVLDEQWLEVTATAIPGDYLFTVGHSPGVLGTPEKGEFYYNQGEQVTYSFSLEDGYVNMRVQLDGVVMPSSGTITFDRAHTLHVLADKYYEIRGTWTIEEAYEDGSKFKVTATFSGDSTSGTVTDSDGGTGTYTTSGPTLSFTMVYPTVSYSYTGSFTDSDAMYGYSKRISSAGTYNGAWTGSLITSTTASTFFPVNTAGKGRK